VKADFVTGTERIGRSTPQSDQQVDPGRHPDPETDDAGVEVVEPLWVAPGDDDRDQANRWVKTKTIPRNVATINHGIARSSRKNVVQRFGSGSKSASYRAGYIVLPSS
jgi:hypothetical protein